MKIVINKCYGGYGLSDWALKELGIEYSDEINRTQPDLISLIENFPEMVNGDFAKLSVVEIPDETTDWEIFDYDGLESITYVINGKLFHK